MRSFRTILNDSATAIARSWREHKAAWVIVLVFATIHALVSFPNHYLFRSHALDLGLYTHASWNYAHFQFDDSSMIRGDGENLLADHFDLHLMLWSPLIHLFGQWTLLIVQVVAIALAAVGAYRYLLALGHTRALAAVGMCMIPAFFGTFNATAFDFHSNVVVSMALPWYFLALYKGNRMHSWLLVVFMIIGKENIGLWLGFVVAAAAFLPGASKLPRSVVLMQAAVCITWAITVIGVIMPAFSARDEYAHFDYTNMGSSMGDMAVNLLMHPLLAFSAIFSDVVGVDPKGTSIKLEFLFLLLVSGGWVFLRKWQYMLMLLPLLAQKLYSDNVYWWSALGHYCTDFGPLLFVVYAQYSTTIASKVWKRIAMVAGALGCAVAAHYTWEIPIIQNDPERQRFYQAQHYTSGYGITPIRHALSLIPDGVPVSAQSSAVPHLIDRDRLYMFPYINDAEYVILTPIESTYPVRWEDYNDSIAKYRRDPEWELLVDHPVVLLFHRKAGNGTR